MAKINDVDNKEVINKRIEQLNQEAYMLEAYKEIRDRIIQDMQWNSMQCNSADEEHEDTWFSVPSPDDDYKYPKYLAYQEMLKRCDNAVLGGK